MAISALGLLDRKVTLIFLLSIAEITGKKSMDYGMITTGGVVASMNGILYRSAPFLNGLEPAFRLLMGPVLFLYVQTLVSPSVAMRKSLFLHLGGALLLMPLRLPFYLEDRVFKMLFDVFLVAKPALRAEPQGELRRKYEKSGISEEDGDLLLERLDRAVRSKRPYTDPDLTLSKLAALLHASPQHLSQLLNQRLGTSFYDYVNRLRVEEVKLCLVDPHRIDESVLDMALECGFNSKSAFNRIFKQHTALSPTQFRQQAGACTADK